MKFITLNKIQHLLSLANHSMQSIWYRVWIQEYKRISWFHFKVRHFLSTKQSQQETLEYKGTWNFVCYSLEIVNCLIAQRLVTITVTEKTDSFILLSYNRWILCQVGNCTCALVIHMVTFIFTNIESYVAMKVAIHEIAWHCSGRVLIRIPWKLTGRGASWSRRTSGYSNLVCSFWWSGQNAGNMFTLVVIYLAVVI